MTFGDPSSHAALGFLTVLAHESQGLVGGYLVLNTAGRPLEFHCTAPVKPNRAQQILFGPTLDNYLYGEQIGQTLIKQCAAELAGVFTDVELALAVRDYVPQPVALVLAGDAQAGAPPSSPSLASRAGSVWRVDASHQPRGPSRSFAIGRNRLAVPAHRQTDEQAIKERLEPIAGFDLSEPFARIRQAIEEAHR